MSKLINIENLRICQPLPASNTFHIFNKDNSNMSLCGRYGMIRMNEEVVEKVTGKEHWKRGQDCKECFRKAGLNVGESKNSS